MINRYHWREFFLLQIKNHRVSVHECISVILPLIIRTLTVDQRRDVFWRGEGAWRRKWRFREVGRITKCKMSSAPKKERSLAKQAAMQLVAGGSAGEGWIQWSPLTKYAPVSSRVRGDHVFRQLLDILIRDSKSDFLAAAPQRRASSSVCPFFFFFFLPSPSFENKGQNNPYNLWKWVNIGNSGQRFQISKT